MEYFKTLLLIGSIALFTACGGGSSGDSSTPIDYYGIYDIVAQPTTSVDKYGNECGDASGIMNISNSIVSGSLMTSYGDLFLINGEVSPDGYIAGGYAVADFTVATYDGQMHASGGSGNWTELNGCSGTWNAIKK